MSDYNSNNNMIMDWDDALENDGQEYVVLEEGDYNFTVTGFERGRFPGSAKIPPCNKAALTLAVDTPDADLPEQNSSPQPSLQNQSHCA